MAARKKGKSAPKKSRSGSRLLPAFEHATPEERKHLRILLALILGAYLVSFSTEPITTIDSQVMLSSAMSLVKTGRLIAPTRFASGTPERQAFGMVAATGDVYSKYPPGYPVLLALLLLPARAAGTALGSLAAEVVLCLASVAALAFTALLLWRFARRMGFRAGTADLLFLGFALGSFAWPYAGDNFSEPLQMLCLTASLYCLVSARQNAVAWKGYTILGGAGLGYAILTKASLGLFAPVFVLAALSGWVGRIPFREAFWRAGVYSVPAWLASAYLLASNALLFGSPQEFGYGSEAFGSSFATAAFALTVSLEKGIFWFAPMTLLSAWGAVRLCRQGSRWIGLTLVVSCLAYSCLIASWYGFEGGNCWGPRLLAPVLPFLLLLSGAAMDAFRSPWPARLLVGLGIVVNLAGVMINYQA
ncbi:MAG: hypothetical protein ABIG68_05015, partial [Acidobacteriota bacterium]